MCCNNLKALFSFFPPSITGLGIWLLIIIIISTITPAAAQTCTGIPNLECQALYAIYNSTGGEEWDDNTNWLSTEPAGDWYGVTVEDGHVTRIDIKDNDLDGPLPSEIGNLVSLKWLHLNQNSLSGEIPPELGNLVNLIWLDLPSNQLTGDIPPELGNLSSLERLNLSSNYTLGGEIPPEIGNLGSLLHLELRGLDLTGEIPPELGDLAELRLLYLDVNDLTGEIPPELGNLTKLHTMYISSNQLNGEIPPELGNLNSLQQLYMQSNQLSGAIPSELGNLGNLQKLFLNNNSLCGVIPDELGNLNSIENIHLGYNCLYGDLPAFLGTPPDNLNLSYNCIFATDPTVLAAVEAKHSGHFLDTQTIEPANVAVATTSSLGTLENRVRVSWDPIAYNEDEGGYKVYYRQSGTTEFNYFGMTADKDCSELTVANLEPGTSYEFRVNTVTWAHSNNRNNLESEGHETAAAVTGTLARAFIPLWKQKTGYFTGVVASNFGGAAFNLNLAAYGPDGIIEPQGHSQQAVNAGRQISKLGWELFHGNPYHEDFSWIELGAENSNRMGSIFLFGVSDTQMLDGAEAQTSYAKRLYFTRPIEEGFFQGWDPEFQMCLVNPTEEEVTVICKLQGSNGYSQRMHTIPSRGFVAGDYGVLTYPNSGIINAYMDIEVTEGQGIIGFSRIEFPAVRTALGMNAVEQTPSFTLYSAQLAHGSNIVTNLRLVNTAGVNRRVNLKAIGDDGTQLADSVQVVIPGHQIYSADLGTIFGLESEGVITTGSLVIESDGHGIIGDIIFADGDTLDYAMALPLQDRLFEEAVFNHISNLPTVFTGFAFFNPGTAAATVLIEAFGTDGTVVAQKTLNLAPGERIARILNDPDIWPAFPTQSGGYIRIQSDQPIAGQQLFGDRALRYMAAIPPTTRNEAMFD